MPSMMSQNPGVLGLLIAFLGLTVGCFGAGDIKVTDAAVDDDADVLEGGMPPDGASRCQADGVRTRLPIEALPMQSYFVPDFEAVRSVDCTFVAPPANAHAPLVLSRTTGCGVVTYELTAPFYRRRQTYDEATNEVVGKLVSDDAPRQIAECTDDEWVAGVDPTSQCTTTDVVYCAVPGLEH